LVGAAHVITDIKFMKGQNPKAFPAFKYMGENPSIAVTPKSVIDKYGSFLDTRRTSLTPYFGVWVEDLKEGTFETPFSSHSFVFSPITPFISTNIISVKECC
jgi:hypothetical protein